MLGNHTFKVLALGAGILAASFTMAGPASAGFEEGVNAYLKKNYALALAEWRPLAEQGHSASQFGMGLAYERGLGVQQNPALAAGWYKKAAALGEDQAAERLDLLRSRGIEATDLPPTDGTPPALALEGGGGEPGMESGSDDDEPAQTSTPAETPTAAVGNEPATPTATIEADSDPAPKPVAEKPTVKKSAASTKNEITVGTDTSSGSRTAAPGKQVSSLAGSHRVRLASYRDPSNGPLGWKTLTRKYGDALLELNWAMAEVDLGDKGVYHRLEAGPLGSREEAIAVCAEIKAGGDSCLAVKP